MLGLEIYINSDSDFGIYSTDLVTSKKTQQPEKIYFYGETDKEIKLKVQAYVLLLSFENSYDYLFETITILTADLNDFAFGQFSILRDIDFEYGNQSIQIRTIKIL